MIRSMMILRRVIFILGALALMLLAAQNANGSTLALSLDVQFLLLAGGAIAMLYTAASRGFPPDRTSSGMALLGTASMIAGALGPALAGALATLSIQSIFLIDSGLFGLAMVLMLLGWKQRAAD